MALYLEDFAAGQVYESGAESVSAAQAAEFGAEFAGVGPLLVASLTMRMLVQSGFAPAGGIMGAGIEDLRWPAAVADGAMLRVRTEVLEVRASKSRPERGLVRVRTETRDEAGALVQTMISTCVVQSTPGVVPTTPAAVPNAMT